MTVKRNVKRYPKRKSHCVTMEVPMGYPPIDISNIGYFQKLANGDAKTPERH